MRDERRSLPARSTTFTCVLFLICVGLGVLLCWLGAIVVADGELSRFFSPTLWISHSVFVAALLSLAIEFWLLYLWRRGLTKPDHVNVSSWLEAEVSFARERTLEHGRFANPSEILTTSVNAAGESLAKLSCRLLGYAIVLFLASAAAYLVFSQRLVILSPDIVDSSDSVWKQLSPIVYVALGQLLAIAAAVIVLMQLARATTALRCDAVKDYVLREYRVGELEIPAETRLAPQKRELSPEPPPVQGSHPLPTPQPTSTPLPFSPVDSAPPPPAPSKGNRSSSVGPSQAEKPDPLSGLGKTRVSGASTHDAASKEIDPLAHLSTSPTPPPASRRRRRT